MSSKMSIDKGKNLTSDVYGINEYVNEIKKKFTPEVNDDTLMLGIFGYTGQVFSDLLQNTIVMASEFSNESIPTRAKFEKNIIAHALGLGITDINATPAQFDVLMTFIEDDIINWANARDANGNELPWSFTFDKDTPIYIGDYCFHTDYDIEIRKIALKHSGKENKFAYTAKYVIDVDNPISDVKNPYLTSPVKMNVNGKNVIFTKCTLHQVSKQTIHKKILSDSSIASKTITFSFEGQLAAFTVDVKEGDKDIHLVPVYDGLSVENMKYPYFYFTYMDSNTIRIKFNKDSYAPRINSDLTINIQTTKGEHGNFVFKPENGYPGFSFESEKYAYSNIGCEIKPITGESLYGADKKSIKDLKTLIPKEALSRGSITNMSDLENYFNMINTDNSILYFYKKRDNALERLYYSFIIIRDGYNNIIPMNTINVRVPLSKLQADEDGAKYVFKKGQVLRLDPSKGYAEVYDKAMLVDDTSSNFFDYVIPYNLIINKNPLYGMYYLMTIDSKKFLDFSYINEKCLYQYIATSVSMYRGYVDNPNTYEMTLNIEQNIEADKNAEIIEYDEHGNIAKVNLRCVAVFYGDDDSPLRWAEAKFIRFDKLANIFTYKFNFTSEDYIDVNNKIRIDTGLFDIKSNNPSYAHLSSNTKCVIHILSKQGAEYGLNKLDEIIPDLTGYTLSNSYTVSNGIDFFYDYSEIVNSTVIANKGTKEGEEEYFSISEVPVVKNDYFNIEGKVVDFCKELVNRKTYIEYAMNILEDAFGMDFKFFNTYGPSKLYATDKSGTNINSTNLSLKFKIKLNANYDTNVLNDIIEDIKSYIEDINTISSIHMTNLVSDITAKYSEYLVYFEFVDINGKGASIQHLYALDMPEKIIVPEFANINTNIDGTPDITLIVE